MTLEEVIRQRLAEANKPVVEQTTTPDAPVVEIQAEAKKPMVPELKDVEADEVGCADEVETKPKKKTMAKESKDDESCDVACADDEVETKKKKKSKDKKMSMAKESVSGQVNALLETEGLSEDFKTQAATIFEAAIADQVLLIEAKLQTEFDSKLAEAKLELDNDIDGFLSEAVQQWKQDNEVAIKANFKSQVAESFVDGMKALIAEHNIEVPEDKENALEVAIAEVDKLNESIVASSAEMLTLQEEINVLKAEKILESFKEKMTQTEFDRFTQLTESFKFTDAAQYTKQLTIVLENFGSNKNTKVESPETIIEAVQVATHKVITESNSDMSHYASYISKQIR